MKRIIFLSLLVASPAFAECRNGRYISGALASDVTDTTSTAVIAAQGSGVRVDLVSVVVTNSSTTATVVKVLNGATTKARNYAVGSGGGFSVNFGDAPIKGAANTAWNIQAETTSAALQATFTGCVVP